MRKLLIVALIALPVLVLLTLPAGLVIPRFDPPAALGQYGGTVWSGQARWRQPGQVPMNLVWRWRGGLRWHWELFDGVSRLQGLWRPGKVLRLEAVQGRLTVDRLDLAAWLPLSPPQGHLNLALDQVDLVAGEPPRVSGLIIWEDARLAGVVQTALGRVEVRFDPAPELRIARVRSLTPAPVTVQGRLEWGQEGQGDRYRADLWLRAAPDQPDLAAQLGALGERQADGQVRVQLEGQLGLSRTVIDHEPGVPAATRTWASTFDRQGST